MTDEERLVIITSSSSKNSEYKDHFIGLVLTHSNKYKDNVKMNSSHFNKFTRNDCFTFDDTHVVKIALYKPRDWGPYKKCGELTEEGIEFVSRIVDTNSKNAVCWNEYINNL